jgi:hypothetical protein
MAIHHVNVNPVGPRQLGFSDLLAQTGKISGEDRRRELYDFPVYHS